MRKYPEISGDIKRCHETRNFAPIPSLIHEVDIIFGRYAVNEIDIKDRSQKAMQKIVKQVREWSQELASENLIWCDSVQRNSIITKIHSEMIDAVKVAESLWEE